MPKATELEKEPKKEAQKTAEKKPETKAISEKNFYAELKKYGKDGEVMKAFYDKVLKKGTDDEKELNKNREYILKENRNANAILDEYGKTKGWKDDVEAFRKAAKAQETPEKEAETGEAAKLAEKPKLALPRFTEEDAKGYLEQFDLDEEDTEKCVKFYDRISKMKGINVKEIFEARAEDFASEEGTARGVDRPFNSAQSRDSVMKAWNSIFEGYADKQLEAVAGRGGRFGYRRKTEAETQKPPYVGGKKEETAEGGKKAEAKPEEKTEAKPAEKKEETPTEKEKEKKAETVAKKQVLMNEKLKTPGEPTLEEYIKKKMNEINEQVAKDIPDETRKWERDRSFSFWDLLIVPAIWKYGVSYLTDAVGLTGGEDTKVSKAAERTEAVQKRMDEHFRDEETRRNILEPSNMEYKEGRFYWLEEKAKAEKKGEPSGPE